MHSIKILSTRIDNITFDETTPLVHTFLTDNNPHQIITANSLMLLEVQKDTELKKIFGEASLVIPESAGVFWASQFLKIPLKEKIPGIDFMFFLLNYAQENGYSVFFLGTKEKIITEAVEKIRGKFPKLKIAGYNNGYFFRSPCESKEEFVITKIKDIRPDILFVGLNTPFQEIWIYKNIKNLGVKIAMGIGGSFDVISGKLRRAPLWMRNSGGEWLFRFIQQPWRITRISKLFLFISEIIKERIKQ